MEIEDQIPKLSIQIGFGYDLIVVLLDNSNDDDDGFDCNVNCSSPDTVRAGPSNKHYDKPNLVYCLLFYDYFGDFTCASIFY